MGLLPEWAPNAHPFLVHFPIALLVAAVAIDWAGIVSGRAGAHTLFTTGLYLLGTGTLALAYVTGRGAANTVLLPGMAHGVVNAHWTWALGCLCLFLPLTLLRLGLRTRRYRVRFLLAVGGLVGLVLLTRTADLGGRLVYEHGVGTHAATRVRGQESR